MKRLYAVIGLVLIFSGCSTSGHGAVSVVYRGVFSLDFPPPYPVEVRHVGLEEELLINILADYYDVRRGLIRDYRRYGFSIPEIAVILEMADISGIDPDYIADLRDRGYSWSRIASRIGLRIRSYGGIWRVSDRDLEDAIMAKVLGEYFSYEPALILRMRKVGYDYGPIAVIVNISAISRLPVTYVIRGGVYRSWEDMARAYRISLERISLPYRRVYVEERVEVPGVKWRAFDYQGERKEEVRWKERERSPVFKEKGPEPSSRYYKRKEEEKEVDKAREYRKRKGSGR